MLLVAPIITLDHGLCGVSCTRSAAPSVAKRLNRPSVAPVGARWGLRQKNARAIARASPTGRIPQHNPVAARGTLIEVKPHEFSL